jgi:hypothetical protein
VVWQSSDQLKHSGIVSVESSRAAGGAQLDYIRIREGTFQWSGHEVAAIERDDQHRPAVALRAQNVVLPWGNPNTEKTGRQFYVSAENRRAGYSEDRMQGVAGIAWNKTENGPTDGYSGILWKCRSSSH